MISLRIWFLTNIIIGITSLGFVLIDETFNPLYILAFTAITFIITFPALIILLIAAPIIRSSSKSINAKRLNLIAVCAILCMIYSGLFSGILCMLINTSVLTAFGMGMGILFIINMIAMQLSNRQLKIFFNEFSQSTIKKANTMETLNQIETPSIVNDGKHSNKIFVKGLLTAGLILLMLVPTIFINNLVQERQSRQADVVKEVSSKWAEAQTLTGPYIYLPYKVLSVDKDKKTTETLQHVFIIPNNLTVNGKISHEIRLRSIYKVLLYNAEINNTGNFKFQIPKDIDGSLIQWQDAKICFGLSDFKGIEERLVISFKGSDYELSPGLPVDNLNDKGLSSSIPLSNADQGENLEFNIHLKIKGSEQLHFVPLSGDSHFTLSSTWAHPSFDGNNLPSIRTVNETGFTASWNFNKANLPFGAILKDFKLDLKDLAFGVTMIQPADGYAKTNRCIKYAILFIGLTFSLFFIIELLQKKPLHPVQYILVGVALTIFYSLLLSFSEFMPFDLSYLIASIAIIMLISFFAYGHFKKAKTAFIFGSMLTLLFGFTFVLIRLEDTALLIGSIGLFIILALAMFASRKINWYGVENIPEMPAKS